MSTLTRTPVAPTRAPRSAMGGPAAFLVSHRRLLWRATRTELASRHAGSILGSAWVVLGPLIILAIYGIVYLGIFRARVAGLTSTEYVVFLFAGLVPFLMTAEALSAGVSSLLVNRAALNNTVFPIDLAPVKTVMTSQATMAFGLLVVIVGSVAVGRASWTMLGVPLVWAAHVAALIGVAWVVSLLNVVFRDLQNLVNAFVIVLLIASPIAYTPEMVPSSLKLLITLNPFAYFVIAYQKLLVLGEFPSAVESVVIAAEAVAAFAFGSWFFARAKRALVDYV